MRSEKERIESYCEEMRKSIERWKDINKNGCNDPFWADGSNMNLVRNHIIYYKHMISEICKENQISLPDEYYFSIPPEVNNHYMANRKQKERVKRLESTGFKLDKRVIQHEPLGFHDYNCLQMNAFCVVSDSGTLPEESSFFTSIGKPFPAVCIRTSTERPEALDKACFILSGIDEKGLLQSVDTAVEMNRNGDYGIPVPDYIEENVSSKVVKIIQSYTGVVNKMVWRKDT